MTGRWATTTGHLSGIALTAVAAGLAACTVLEAATSNRDTVPMLAATVLLGGAGLLLWRFTEVGRLTTADTFAAVAWTWVLVSVTGSLPYLLAGVFAPLSFGEQVVNSIFESASGFSCTGSTALRDFDGPGRGLMMFRQLTQWYGGMGVIVLAVAVLPFLGVGGLELIRAEAPGPSSDRLTPRVAETAKRLWLVYAALTGAIALALFIAPGPGLYDSVAHALTTSSTGGFSPEANSVGAFDSLLIEVLVMIGLILGGMNFALHWRAVMGDRGVYWRDAELRLYLGVLALATAAVAALLWIRADFPLATALRAGVFNVVTLGTSGGFGIAQGPGTPGDYVTWAPAPQLILLFLMVFGAMTGSTSGGVKMLRLRVGVGHTIRTIKRPYLRRAVLPVHLGQVAVPDPIVSRVVGFLLVYTLLVVVGLLAVTTLGADVETALGAVVGSLGNMGPALGEAGPTASFSDAFTQPARLVLAALMLIGRLELFPMLLMFAAPRRALLARAGGARRA